MEKLYSIQEVSRLLGIPKDTLRYYDPIGIVSPSREDNRYMEKVSWLLSIAAETLRNITHESDQQLAEIVREIYKDIRKDEHGISMEGCDEHQG